MKTFDMPPDTMDGFDPKRGAWVIKHLMEDLDPLMDFQAAGIVGNLAGESGIQAINEIRPLVPGSRGGWSWAQWTGPRRVAFEEHAAARGLDIRSDEAAYEFLVKELRTTERRALERLRKTKNIEDATYVFEVAFERPSDPHGGLPARIRFARRALDYHIFNGRVSPVPLVETPSQPERNDTMNYQMKGWRTLIYGFGLSVAPVVLTYMDQINWDAFGPTITFFAGLGVMLLRVFTTTNVGKKV